MSRVSPSGGESSGGRPKRAPGRPAGDPAIRRRLLETALREFSAHGFRGVTVTAIARAAGVTAAMVHYYFGSKKGLYRAVLQRALGPVVERLEAVMDDPPDNADVLPHLVRGYMRVLAENPEVPALIVRDVLSPEGEMRAAFVQGFASRGGRGLRELIRRARQQGRLRADLDPDLGALSLLSMAVFPFVGAPVARQVLEYSLAPERVDALADHTVELFYRGAGA